MRPKTILLVEDDYLDVTSVKRALNKLNVKHELHVAHNGVDALAILNGNATGAKVLPDLILLDLNMPKMSGLEFLGIIRNYYSLKNIRIFIMTTSAEEYDIAATQQLGVNGYVLKPLDFETTKKDKYSLAAKHLKEVLLSDMSKMGPPLFIAGGSISAGIKSQWLALKKAGMSLAGKAVAVKTTAIGVAAFTAMAVVISYKKADVPAKPAQPAVTMKAVARPVAIELPALAEQPALPTSPVKPIQAVPARIEPPPLAKQKPVIIPRSSFKIAVTESEDEGEDIEAGSRDSTQMETWQSVGNASGEE